MDGSLSDQLFPIITACWSRNILSGLTPEPVDSVSVEQFKSMQLCLNLSSVYELLEVIIEVKNILTECRR